MAWAAPGEAKRLAVLAAARGWLGAAEIWEAALLFASGASPEEVFPLSEDQLFALRDGTGEFAITLERPIGETPPSSAPYADTPSDLRSLRNTPPPHSAAREAPTRGSGRRAEVGGLSSARRPGEGYNDGAPWAFATPSAGIRLAAEPARYEIGPILGQGGNGIVYTAYDRKSGRTVALKRLKDGNDDPLTLQRFLTEARVAAQLEHPSVIPIYDLGTLADGAPFYTMRVVKRTSLREIMKDPGRRAGWTLSRLCGLFAQVCRGLAYAHARGVVHRDLKPANILVGEYGEVYIADWGVCKVLPEGEISGALADLSQSHWTLLGTVLGTPGYLSPEQARGEVDSIDGRADLFSLGVVLYQVITNQRPFPGATAEQVLDSTVSVDPRPPRELNPSCSPGLSALCMRLLAKEREARPASAAEVAIELDSFLEGVKDKARRRQEAWQMTEQASDLAQRYRHLLQEKEQLQRQAQALLSLVHPWDPVEKKRPGWAVEEQARGAALAAARVLAESVERFSQALGYDPDALEAKRGLAGLYLARAQAAEAAHDEAEQLFYEAMVREYDDGSLSASLSADGLLSLRTNPPGARAFLARYEERDRRLVPGAERPLGEVPLRELRLSPGRYLLTLRRMGFREARYPLLCKRGEHLQLSVNLYAEAELGEEFVYIPGGSVAFGGDPAADNALPREEVYVPDFAIARFPVRFSEYLAFVNDLWADNPRYAERRLPRGDGVDGLYVQQDLRGLWVPRYRAILQHEGRHFCPEERVGELPILAVDWFDAMAYCRWRSARDGVVYRLPTEAEFEKAARGTDGRAFPWGDRFDATFCKMRESRPGLSQPEPVGSFPQDESPYGVRDLAGSARTWTVDLHGSPPEPLEEFESGAEDDRVRGVRGGSWGTTEARCRAASRHARFVTLRTLFLGMRLVKPLPPRALDAEETHKLQRPW